MKGIDRPKTAGKGNMGNAVSLIGCQHFFSMVNTVKAQKPFKMNARQLMQGVGQIFFVISKQLGKPRQRDILSVMRRSNRILAQADVNPDTRVRDLTDEEVARIRDVIDETVTVEGDLRREIALNIKRLQEIGCYRGIRHRKGLPVRGQKTKNNARTRKGPRRTVANKKK